MSKKEFPCIKDDIYLPRYSDNEYQRRNTVRCILLNEKNEIGLLLIDRDDKFGKMKHYETPGGGIKEGETELQALQREIQEEVGYKIKNIVSLCNISNEYNLLKRIDRASYYLAYISEKGETNFDDYEVGLITGLKWFPILKYKEYYEEFPPHKVSHIIYQRDMLVIDLAIKYLKENNIL